MSVDWATIRHFTRAEWVTDPDRISPDVVLLMDDMRDAANVSIEIHVAYDESGHVSDSSHYATAREFATAVDFHFVGWSLLDQWLFAERYPWSGIGLYPYWTSPGLHCDLRRLGRDHPQLGKRWWRDKDGTYRAIDRMFMASLVAWPPRG